MLLVLCYAALGSAQTSTAVVEPEPSWKFIENKLIKEGFSKNFVRDLTVAYEPRDFNQVIELNVLLFLRKSDYHGIQVNAEAEREALKFAKANRKSLALASKQNRVPAEVVSSLLWIESRHGRNTGNFHVPSVYLHLIQAPRKVVQEYLLTRTDKYATDPVTPEQHREIVARTHRKAKWALEELRALQKVYNWKWKMGRDFRGSFSGAFGIPQFLPSSYVKWARAVKRGTQPNLSMPADAVMSVAYYLRDHGWKTGKQDTEFEALMKYNNSRDYATAILQLADKISGRRDSTARIIPPVRKAPAAAPVELDAAATSVDTALDQMDRDAASM